MDSMHTGNCMLPHEQMIDDYFICRMDEVTNFNVSG